MSASESLIRAAKPQDLCAVRDMLTLCGLPSSDLASDKLGGFWVAVLGTDIVGVAGLEVVGVHALLRSVAVRADLRKSGLGNRLVDTCLVLARQQDIRGIYLIPNDTAAGRFFARRGFTEIAREDVPPPLRHLSEFTYLCPQTHPCLHLALRPEYEP